MFALRWSGAGLVLFAALSPSLAASQSDAEGPQALDRKFQSALAHFNSAQYAAQQELEALARTLPNSFEVQELLGQVYSAEGQRAYYFLGKSYDRAPSLADEVAERFRRFSDFRPRDAQATLYYAMSLWKGRRSETSPAYLDQVESLLKKAIALDPSSPDAHLQLGNLYSQRHQYAEAAPEYQQALRLSPNVPDGHFRLGQAYVHLGKNDLAEKEFQLHKQL
jgi:tetratricopeptide (TPR) repeat protein